MTQSQSVTLIAAAVDDVAVTKVEFYEGTTKLSEAAMAPFAHVITITAAENGTHTYLAKALAVAGHATSSAPVTLTVTISTVDPGTGGGAASGGGTATGGGSADGGGSASGGDAADTTPPVVSLMSSVTTVTSAGDLVLTATATDNVGVAKVEFWDGLKKVGEIATKISGTNNYALTLTVSAADFGLHRFSARAFDAAVNSAVSSIAYVNVLVTVPSGIKDIAGGNGFTFILKNDGSVLVAGGSQYNATGGVSSPVFVQSLAITDVSALGTSGASYTMLFIKSADGTVRCMGDGQYSQCGTAGGSASPVSIAGLSGTATDVSVSSSACARKTDGTVWCWAGYQGNPSINNTPNPQQVVQADGGSFGNVSRVVACVEGSYAIKDDGSLWGWGRDDMLQLGDGTAAFMARFTPVQIRFADLSPVTNVVDFACGAAHKVLAVADGGVFTIGFNSVNQLGVPGQPVTYSAPVAVPVTGLSGIVDVAAGHSFSLALDSNGTVFAWGNNPAGELGNGTSGNSNAAASQVAGLPVNIVKVATSSNAAFALTGDGRVYGWGNAGQGVTDAGTAVVHPVLISLP